MLNVGNSIFAVERTSPEGNEIIISVSNFSPKQVKVALEDEIPSLKSTAQLKDIITENIFGTDGKKINLKPYQTVWLIEKSPDSGD